MHLQHVDSLFSNCSIGFVPVEWCCETADNEPKCNDPDVLSNHALTLPPGYFCVKHHVPYLISQQSLNVILNKHWVHTFSFVLFFVPTHARHIVFEDND